MKQLLQRFFDVAPAEIRAAFIETLGRIAHDAKGGLRDDQVDRMRDLWAKRFTHLTQVKDTPNQLGVELAPFAWWYASGRLGDDWAIDQLGMLLRAGGTLNPGHVVLERLAVDAPNAPAAALRVLLDLVRHPPDEWLFVAVTEELRAIIRAGLAGDATAQDLARRAVDELAARGVEVAAG